MRGEYAILRREVQHGAIILGKERSLLVCGVEQEDSGDDSISSRVILVLGVDSTAHGLHDEEEEHANGGGDEEKTTTDLVNKGGGDESPSQVPDLKDTVDEELVSAVGNTDSFQNCVEVVRDETIAGPLGEESDGNDDAHTLAVSGGGKQGLPANLLGHRLVEVDGVLDLFIFVLDQRILVVSVGVIVGEGLQGLLVATLADEPTWGLGGEPDEAYLDDRGEGLESRGDAP